MLATFVAYMRACEAAGVAPDKAVPKIAVSLAADADQFMTIAKLRAARRLVWRVAEACGAGSSAAQRSFHRRHVMAHDGEARSVDQHPAHHDRGCAARRSVAPTPSSCCPFTYALGQPDRFARRVARNIQIVFQEECNLGRVTDPAGGSWYVEKLTDDLAQKAWALFQDIEAQRAAWPRRSNPASCRTRLRRRSRRAHKAIATGRQELTGVSAFPMLGDDGVKPEPWAKGTAAPAKKAIEVKPLKMARLAEPFEALRDAADAHAAKSDKPYQVFLASIGEVIDHTVRSTWVKNYLAAGGIAALTSDGYPNAGGRGEGIHSAVGASAACICSSDALNAEHAEATAKALKAAGAKLVLMAGKPGEREASLKGRGSGPVPVCRAGCGGRA